MPMSESLEVSRTAISGLMSVNFLAAIPASLIFGKIVSRRDVKWPMAACCAFVGIGYIIYATGNSLLMLYVGAVFIGFGVAGTIQIPAAIFIDGWFIKKKGLAMGITMVGSGIGGTVLSQILSKIIVTSGWQMAAIGMGIAIIITTVPLTLLFVTKSPHTKGFVRYGEEDKEYIENLNKINSERIDDKEIAPKTIFKRTEFWLLFTGVFLFVWPMGALKTHVVAYMGDIGYSPTAATLCLTLMTFFVIPGKPCIGWCFDKLGSRIATLICGICMAGGVFIFLGAVAGIVFAMTFAVIYGFGSAMASVGLPLILKDTVYTGTSFAIAFSVVNLAFNIASASGPPLMAMIQANTGSYSAALIAAGVVIAIGYLLGIIAITIGKNKQKLGN